MGRDVVLVSSADETAFEVRSILADTGLGRRTGGKGAHRFVSSGDVAWFRDLGSRLLGPRAGRGRGVDVAGLNASVSVTVLGCCGSYPGAGGACSGYLVDDGTTRLWLDAGSGTLANLQRHCALDDVDALVLSHEHPDHWADVEGWVIALRHLTAPRGIPCSRRPGCGSATYHPSEPYLAWNVVADGDRCPPARCR